MRTKTPMATAPRDWYRAWFDDDYLQVYGHRDEEDARQGVALLGRHQGPGRGPVLDLGCRAGRHLGLLLQAGYRAWGLDLSPALLAAARRALPGAPVVRGDMRRLPCRGRSLAAVLSFFTSFGYFDDEGDRRVLAEAARALAPGGVLFLDLAERETTVARLEARGARQAGLLSVLEERSWDPLTRRLTKRLVLSDARGERERFESVRLYGGEEIAERLAAAGLVPEARYGDHQGGPHRPGESPRLVVVARRPA